MIDMKELRRQQRADAMARVEIREHARQPVKSALVRLVVEFDQRVGVYLDSKTTVQFYAKLPDGREVVGAAFEDVDSAVRWCIRDAIDLDWQPFIHIKRSSMSNSSSASEILPSEARDLLLSGEPPPDWVFAGTGIELSRLYLAKRPDGDWVCLHWDRLSVDDQEPWELARNAKRHHGIAPEGAEQVPPLEAGRARYGTEVLLPYTDQRWDELSLLARKLRTLHLHVASLFADDGTGRKFLAARLLDGLPLFGSTNLLGGPSGEST